MTAWRTGLSLRQRRPLDGSPRPRCRGSGSAQGRGRCCSRPGGGARLPAPAGERRASRRLHRVRVVAPAGPGPASDAAGAAGRGRRRRTPWRGCVRRRRDGAALRGPRDPGPQHPLVEVPAAVQRQPQRPLPGREPGEQHQGQGRRRPELPRNASVMCQSSMRFHRMRGVGGVGRTQHLRQLLLRVVGRGERQEHAGRQVPDTAVRRGPVTASSGSFTCRTVQCRPHTRRDAGPTTGPRRPPCERLRAPVSPRWSVRPSSPSSNASAAAVVAVVVVVRNRAR